MTEHKVAVVILNFNGIHFLKQFLHITVKHSANAKIIVADNASTDNSVIFVKENYPNIEIITNSKNNGYAGGYNHALKKVNASYYVLLNSDIEVTEHWLEPIIKAMDEDKSIAACQPKLLDYKNKAFFEYAGAAGGFIDKYGYPFCRGRVFNTIEKDEGQFDTSTEIFWASGACLFVRASAFWEVNGFDEWYFAHMEEIDLCWRLKNIGYKIMNISASKVYHIGGGTLSKYSSQKTFLNFRNNLSTLTKNAEGTALLLKIIYRLFLDGVAGIKFLVEGQPKHTFAVLKAHFAYYVKLGYILKERKKMKLKNNFCNATTGIYNSNIVFDYFLKKKKTFKKFKQF
ncbi:MAG: glycosyltransferase family 2 protein [Bacteroidetes bacterium]|nr:glycosyltransferase family 2 protein [Bacteroidota bacterium]